MAKWRKLYLLLNNIQWSLFLGIFYRYEGILHVKIHKEKYGVDVFLSSWKKKTFKKKIYPELCVCCCTRIIVKNNILNIQLKDVWGEGGSCVAYIKREESMSIVIALQDPLEAVTWLILWGCLMFDRLMFFSDSSLKPLNYCMCFLNLCLCIITGCGFLDLNIFLKVLWHVC